MNTLRKVQWSPYVAGALLGLVSWFSVLIAGKYLASPPPLSERLG